MVGDTVKSALLFAASAQSAHHQAGACSGDDDTDDSCKHQTQQHPVLVQAAVGAGIAHIDGLSPAAYKIKQVSKASPRRADQ